MGTRSLTFVYDGEQPIINMYRQFDGYPSGHGQELAEFLNSFDAMAKDPLYCVVKGTGIALDHLDVYKKSVISKR